MGREWKTRYYAYLMVKITGLEAFQAFDDWLWRVNKLSWLDAFDNSLTVDCKRTI
jgi:hypothetical protein